MTNEIFIRPIEARDNQELARIVRDTLTEFDSVKPGTVYFDPTTDRLFEVFQRERSRYLTAFNGDKMLGAGVFPTENLPPDVCELVKVYLLPEACGLGLGKKLILQCLNQARVRLRQSLSRNHARNEGCDSALRTARL